MGRHPRGGTGEEGGVRGAYNSCAPVPPYSPRPTPAPSLYPCAWPSPMWEAVTAGGGGTGCGQGEARAAEGGRRGKRTRGRTAGEGGGGRCRRRRVPGGGRKGEGGGAGGSGWTGLGKFICPGWDAGREGAATRVRGAGEPGRVYEEGREGRGEHAATIHTIFMHHHHRHTTVSCAPST